MSRQTKTYFKTKFRRGDKPTQQDFADLIDSTFNLADDQLTAGHLPLQLSDSIRYHKDDTGNPHGLNKELLGLESVDNTSDKDKPVSQAERLELDRHALDLNNPHRVTKEQLGVAESALPPWKEYTVEGDVTGALRYCLYDDPFIELCFDGLRCGSGQMNSFLFEDLPFELVASETLANGVDMKINGKLISFYDSANKDLYGVRKFYAHPNERL